MNLMSSPSKARRGNTQAIRHMKGKWSPLTYCCMGIGFGMFVLVCFLNYSHNTAESLTDELYQASRQIQAEAQPIIDANIVPMVQKISDTVKTASEMVSPQHTHETIHGFKKMLLPIPPRPRNPPKDLAKAGDFIYFERGESWDSTPIVIESHKLIFFTVPKAGCTVWKQLFRRMMGFEDWKVQTEETQLPHNPEKNGLKYLSDYTLKDATLMMTSPEWTRAMMVRDPKQRFLSAFLDKSLGNFHSHIKSSCCPDESCVEDAQTVDGFLELCKRCDDDHWRPQHNRIDSKYWPYIDEILHTENSAEDSKRLLERIGAWEEFGSSGWGSDGTDTIFQNKGASGAGEHATYSQWKVWEWYTPATEERVEAFFRADYENPLFGFESGKCLTCITDEQTKTE